MNKWIKITMVLLILGIGAAVLGYFFIYNKPHRDYEKATADFQVSGETLFSAYVSDRSAAETKYNGKVLEVTGPVSAVESRDSLTIVVFVMGEGMFGDEGIRFTLLDHYKEAASALASDQMVTIKGYCTGYNETDVILEKCSIIQ